MESSSNKMPLADMPYREGVGIMLFNQDNKVFVAKRIDTTSDAWQMPQGGIDPGESPKKAAIRELAEETSIKQVKIIGESQHWLTYDLPESIIPQMWGGRYRGQKQKWFAMRFLGDDQQIDLNTKEPEFLEYQWVSAKILPDMIVPFKRELYQALVAEFSYLLD